MAYSTVATRLTCLRTLRAAVLLLIFLLSSHPLNAQSRLFGRGYVSFAVWRLAGLYLGRCDWRAGRRRSSRAHDFRKWSGILC
jgi:hypothetical protein